jgi:two-component system, chemotaxis family, chemotaxis protein CheY
MRKLEQRKSNFKILLIDDSTLSLSSMTESLNEIGYTSVEQISDPKEGIKNIELTDYHLYVIDVVMPDISGIEIAKEITNSERNSCILMLGALDSENILIESIANGANDFLPKPFTKIQLTNTVDKLYNYAIKEKIF